MFTNELVSLNKLKHDCTSTIKINIEASTHRFLTLRNRDTVEPGKRKRMKENLILLLFHWFLFFEDHE